MASQPSATAVAADPLDRRLLNDFQHDFPLTPQPFAALGKRLGIDEAEVRRRLGRLRECGAISRIGAVLTPHRAGWSTLAAMAVPEAELEDVAALISGLPEVNHNYEREHEFNLWFVVAAPDRARVETVLREIEAATGLPVLDLPLIEAYCLDLGFELSWS
jgi:DNA-binding Lrp family transcriptional regulator